MTDGDCQISEFEPLLNQTFTIRIEADREVEAELSEAKVLTNVYTLEGGCRQPFTLIFKLKEEGQISQRMYDLACGGRSWPKVFLVPIYVNRKGRFVQAIFN